MVLLAVVVALLAGACGNAREVVAGAGDDIPAVTKPTPPPGPGRLGGAEDGLVLSVEQGGGLLPPGEHFRRLPLTAVYEDGTVLSPGAMVEIYPGPALPAVTEGRSPLPRSTSCSEPPSRPGSPTTSRRTWASPPSPTPAPR